MNDIDSLKTALIQIGNLPLEFNTRARAIAQREINRMGRCEWRDALTDKEIYKVIDRGGMHQVPPLEEKKMEGTAYQPPQIDMIPVESSNIESVGHDGKEVMRVRFKGSDTRPATDYDYVGASEQDFFDIINAESPGRAYQMFTKARGIKGIKL